MDKKKVKELIQGVISNNVDSLEFGNDKHNAPLRKANSLLHDALIELGKSDWVSVEDGLPPYGYMMVCECKKCFTKYRFHGTIDGKFDFENFADNFLMRVEMEKEEL